MSDKVIVIGGGAAGMMAAIAASENGREVTLIDKNEKLGKKLYITGKGRCNVTNACDREGLFDNVMTNSKFLYSAFHEFGNLEMMDFLEKAGCPLKVERGDRVFPVSDKASDITAALQKRLKSGNVRILLHTQVKSVMTGENGTDEDRKKLKTVGVELKDGSVLRGDSVIVATGGISYPSTGSTGDGYRFASDVGHTVTDRMPSLVPFQIEEKWCKDLMGLSLRNVSVRLTRGGKELYEGFGEMLFTHFGVSGPLILSASSYYVKELLRSPGKKQKKGLENDYKLYIDLKPALDQEQLDRRLIRDFEENRNRHFQNALGGLFPARLIPVIVKLSGIEPDRKINEVTREDRRTLITLMKNLPLTITGVRDYNEAIITKGGVAVREVNPSTMESKRVEGLFFAGEVLDLDALTGGFNLQIAWSTGVLAGRHA